MSHKQLCGFSDFIIKSAIYSEYLQQKYYYWQYTTCQQWTMDSTVKFRSQLITSPLCAARTINRIWRIKIMEIQSRYDKVTLYIDLSHWMETPSGRRSSIKLLMETLSRKKKNAGLAGGRCGCTAPSCVYSRHFRRLGAWTSFALDFSLIGRDLHRSARDSAYSFVESTSLQALMDLFDKC